jgi:uncharacterized protein affecting Mg2+/Co2+ transport
MLNREQRIQELKNMKPTSSRYRIMKRAWKISDQELADPVVEQAPIVVEEPKIEEPPVLKKSSKKK